MLHIPPWCTLADTAGRIKNFLIWTIWETCKMRLTNFGSSLNDNDISLSLTVSVKFQCLGTFLKILHAEIVYIKWKSQRFSAFLLFDSKLCHLLLQKCLSVSWIFVIFICQHILWLMQVLAAEKKLFISFERLWWWVAPSSRCIHLNLNLNLKWQMANGKCK